MTRILRSLLLIALLYGLSGCVGVDYYASSLKGHVAIMAARQSVAKLAADPSTPAALRARMASASAVRQFASDELDLPDNASYRSYVDIDRDYVTWAVFAAPEFSLTPVVRCFPVFGCVPYQGFFSRTSAIRTAAELKRQGLDVHVAGITAYSTLGWTSDPLLSTMFARDEADLAAVVFHELAHQRLYVNDDTGFNEAFAMAVEINGVRKWLNAKGDPAALARYEAGLARHADFLALVALTRDELGALYAGPGAVAEKRAGKSAAIERMRSSYRQMRDRRWNGYAGYDGWFETPANNARLAATSVYNELAPAFMRLFDLCDGDYPRFYAAVAQIADLGKANRSGALQAATACE